MVEETSFHGLTLLPLMVGYFIGMGIALYRLVSPKR